MLCTALIDNGFCMRQLMVLLLIVLSAGPVLAADWQLAKEDKDAAIKVYTREVAGSDLKEFRGEMLLKTRLTPLVALVEDHAAGPRWLHLCKALEQIEVYSPSSRLLYMVSDAPWPVTDRDSVFVTQLTQDASTGAVTIAMESRPDLFPRNDDYIRIVHMTGFWQFIPQQDGRMLVVYQVHAEPGGGIPSWLSNSVVVDNPYYTLRNMASEIQKPAYQKAQLNHIREVF